MANVEKTVLSLSRLKIKDIQTDWVKTIWDNDFTDCEALPLGLNEIIAGNDDLISLLESAKTALTPWAFGQESSTGEGFWTILVENDLSHKSFVTLLFFVMDQGDKRVANAKQRKCALLASELYLTLSMIPGSGAFKIFHPVLFQKVLDFMKLWSQLGIPKGKRKSNASSSAPASQRSSQRSKRQRSAAPPEDEDEEEEEEEDHVYTPTELLQLNRGYFKLLKTLVQFLSVVSLRDCEQAALLCLQRLVELSKMEAETFSNIQFDHEVPVARLQTVPEVCYRGLALLCTNSHGDPATMMQNVLKHLLPSLLMLIGDKGVAANTIPRLIQDIKDQAVAFVCHLIQQKYEEAGMLSHVRTLLQHMCTKVPDKAEYRGRVAEAIHTILCELPGKQYASMIEWIFKLSKNDKISFRLFALDLACMLLDKPERKEDVDPEKAIFLTHKFLVQLILSRCSDNGPTVRARAITGFGQCMLSRELTVNDAVMGILTPMAAVARPVTRVVATPESSTDARLPLGAQLQLAPRQQQPALPLPPEATPGPSHADGDTTPANMETPCHQGEEVTPAQATFNQTVSKFTKGGTPFVTIMLTPGVEITLADGEGVACMMRRRAGDEKVNVRKAAVSTLEAMIRMDGAAFDKLSLEVIKDRCQDPSLSVRKQALISLTQLLLDISHSESIMRAWLDGALSLVVDREQTAQDKCLEILDEILMSNICQFKRSNQPQHDVAWRLMTIMASNEGGEMRRYFTKACQLWGRAGKLRAGLVTSLQSHVGTKNNAATWMVLAEMARFAPKFNPSFVVDYWNDHAKELPEAEYDTVTRVLVVIGYVAKNLSMDQVNELAEDLKLRLMRFDSPPELISITASTLNKLCRAVEQDNNCIKEWFVELVKACDIYLSKVILEETAAEEVNEEELIKHLFTLGEIAQLCPDKTPKRVFMLVQSIIAAPCITSIDGSSQPQQSQNPSQPSQPASQGSQWTQPDALSQFRGSKMSSKVRAHAFITLGKLCLQHEDIAKKCVAAMARELETSPHPPIRTNIVIVLCDLCVRYTTLVDRYVPNIATCLRDENALIRKQTIILLTHLLQEDFLKWKGSLFFRFITTVVDDNEEIKKFAEFCLIQLLMQRHPTMFFNHFIECIFHFNAYENHKAYNKFPQGERERRLFNMKGQQNAEKRMTMYKLMLENMTDEHKFQLTAKLSTEVLAPIVDGLLPFDPDTAAVLHDTLNVLACKEIKLTSLKSRPGGDDVETEQEAAQAVMAQAKKTLISQVMKRNVIENIVPTVISLKHMLEQHRSPVIKSLMLYLREIMKDYKNEVKDIMAADRQLGNEIEFDLRKFEEQEERERQELERQRRRSVNTIQQITPGTSPALRSPRSPKSPSSNTGPGSPGGKAPGTPALPPQVAALRSPRPGPSGTPGRSVPMSTLAIMNSARKAMAQAQKIAEERNSPAKAKTPVNKGREKRVAFRDSTESTDSSIPVSAVGNSDVFKTPTRQNSNKTPNKLKRAISTPAANLSMLGNITFLPDDSSLAPPSPIPTSLPIRMYGDKDKDSRPRSWSVEVGTNDSGQPEQKAVVHMLSPAQPTPKPRTWNVQSPMPRNPRLEDADSDEENQPENTAPKKRRGRSSKSSQPDKESQDKADRPNTTKRRSSSRNKNDTSKNIQSGRSTQSRKPSK